MDAWEPADDDDAADDASEDVSKVAIVYLPTAHTRSGFRWLPDPLASFGESEFSPASNRLQWWKICEHVKMRENGRKLEHCSLIALFRAHLGSLSRIHSGGGTHNTTQIPHLILGKVQSTTTVAGAHVSTRFRTDGTQLTRILWQKANMLGQLLDALLLFDDLHCGLLKRFTDMMGLVKSKPNGYTGLFEYIDQRCAVRRPQTDGEDRERSERNHTIGTQQCNIVVEFPIIVLRVKYSENCCVSTPPPVLASTLKPALSSRVSTWMEFSLQYPFSGNRITCRPSN
uniref:Uncharacterized protein n=1 Tax=Anopheles culicifacies TaxID=139723 RepID=A0A182MNI0_9DIPT